MHHKPPPPPPTEFDRLITRERPYIEAARHHVRGHGFFAVRDAILRDLDAGRLSREKAGHMLAHLPFLLIERICQRVGFTRFDALILSPEFVDATAFSVDEYDQRVGPLSEEQREQLILRAAHNALRPWHLVAQDMGGHRVYEVTPVLAQMLRDTPPRNPPCDTLFLPVPSLLLVVPAEANLTLWDRDGAPRRVTEIYAVEAPPPERRWYLWICAPRDAEIVMTEYVNVSLPPASFLETTIRWTEDALAATAQRSAGWPDCLRWFAGAMRYLADGGVQRERWLDKEARHLHERLARWGPNKPKPCDALQARLRPLDTGRRVIIGLEHGLA
jgi:hypothetical protein